jgi:exonuclease III
MSLTSAKTTKEKRRRGGRGKKGKRAGARRGQLKCDRLGRSNIRIVYWNCASVRQRRPTLDKLLYGSDIMVLQETNLGNGRVRSDGFKEFYNRRHLGQAILVRDNMTASEVDMTRWDCNDMQVHAVRVQTPVPFVIVNVYARNCSVDIAKWQSLLQQEEKNIIFCGDFNARGRQWGNNITNKQGEDLTGIAKCKKKFNINI